MSLTIAAGPRRDIPAHAAYRDRIAWSEQLRLNGLVNEGHCTDSASLPVQTLADVREEDALKRVLGILEPRLIADGVALIVSVALSAALPVVMYFTIDGMERFSAAVN